MEKNGKLKAVFFPTALGVNSMITVEDIALCISRWVSKFLQQKKPPPPLPDGVDTKVFYKARKMLWNACR
jgi:hypothetical protein